MTKHLSLLSKPIAQALANQDVFVKALFERPESLGSLLPYDEFVPQTGIFVNKDGALGAVFEATLLEHEPMVTDQILQSVEGIRPWFNLPSQCVLQVLFEQAHISPLDQCFSN